MVSNAFDIFSSRGWSIDFRTLDYILRLESRRQKRRICYMYFLVFGIFDVVLMT